MQRIAGNLLTINEVAERLRVPASTVASWCRSRQLDAIAIPRGWRIPEAALDRFLEELLDRKTRGADEAGE